MAGYPTSDRLCRVITKNFLAEHELQQKLNSIEKKKRKASVQISLNRLEIKKELQSIVSPENCKIGPSYAKVPPVRQRRVFVLSGSDIPAERKRRNIRSYNELLQKLELKSTTNKSIATTSNHIIKKSIPVQDSSLRESQMRSLPRPVLCRSPVMPEPATKPVFTGVRARFSSLSKYTGGNKSTEACGSVRVQLNESEHRHDTGEPDVTARDCRLRPVNDLAHKRLSRHSFPSLRSRTLRR